VNSYEYDEFMPNVGPSFPSDIHITDLDVNLQKFQMGVSPRRNSNELKSQSVQKVSGTIPGI
jgi:hypothetical protein